MEPRDLNQSCAIRVPYHQSSNQKHVPVRVLRRLVHRMHFGQWNLFNDLRFVKNFHFIKTSRSLIRKSNINATYTSIDYICLPCKRRPVSLKVVSSFKKLTVFRTSLSHRLHNVQKKTPNVIVHDTQDTDSTRRITHQTPDLKHHPCPPYRYINPE